MKQAFVISHKDRTGIVTHYPGLERVDLVVDGKTVECTNTANDDFPRAGLFKERAEKWGRARLKEFRKCDICGKESYAPPLHSYDLEEFPDLEGKVVCSDCRQRRYNKKITKIIRKEKREILHNFPIAGPLTLVNINLCMFPDCNCGWNLTLKINNKEGMNGIQLEGLVVHADGDFVKIGGTSAQWKRLMEICRAAGGELPPGYPPS